MSLCLRATPRTVRGGSLKYRLAAKSVTRLSPPTPIPGQTLEGKERLLILNDVLERGGRGQRSRWIDENPARNLESPKVKQSPFDSDQMVKTLAACEKYLR